MTTLQDIGEREAIRRLCRNLSTRADVLAGAGDDCAVVRPATGGDCDWLLTSDPVIEGIHYTPGTAPAAVGHKAVARVLSDIAAMGGTPQWALVDVTAPRDLDVADLDDLYAGLESTAKAHGLVIAGGDLGCGSPLALHVFAVGTVPAERAVLRSGAQTGDAIYVTGALGGSRQGRHLDFEPRLVEGRWLQSGQWATAMIDVSDGLAGDLSQVARASGLGAQIEAAAIPVAATLRHLDPADALQHALADGEDFELLFTVPVDCAAAFDAAWPAAFNLSCTRIGTITASPGIRLLSPDGKARALNMESYDHFRTG